MPRTTAQFLPIHATRSTGCPGPVSGALTGLLLIGLTIAGGAGAATLRVPADQPTVRAAVNAAASGDTILIAPGIHNGGVYIKGKRVTLASWFLTTQDTAYIAQTAIDSVFGDPCPGSTGCAGNAVLEFASDAGGSAVIGLTLRKGEDGVRSRAPLDLAYCHVLANHDGIDYQSGGGGTVRNSLFMNNLDDGIDINGVINCTFTDNVSRDNHQDGVEFRMYAYTGPMLQIDFIRNRFTGNGGDGIQLIDYPDNSSRVIRMEHNYFSGNGDASVGCMGNGVTSEDFSGSPIAERVYLIHNTFDAVRYGFVGGANVIALNNIFTGTQVSALRRVGGNSITSYSLFWNNAIDYEESVVDAPHLLHADPRLAATGALTSGSPAVDAGTATFQWRGETVLDLPPSAYQGSAPDLGAFEFGVPGGNAAPVVSAGPDQTIILPAGAALDGTVSDDGLPIPPGALISTWSMANGPGAVAFQDLRAVDTQASFTVAGTYLLSLTAGDGALSTTDQVQITVLSSPPAGSGSVDRRVAAGSDDAEESSTGSVSLTSSDLELVFDGSNQTVGMRFVNLTIPAGTTITGAYIQFEADEAQSEVTTLTLRGQAADDAGTFSSTAGNISTRPRTAASVSWSPAAWTLVGEVALGQRTPDLSRVIQEIVSRPGWTSGNSLEISVTGMGHRTARAFEGKAAGAALLHVEYGNGDPPPPVNTAPVLDAGPNQTIALPADALLDATVSDDGLPSPPGSVTGTWSAASGPAPVTFMNASAIDTRATFTTAGTYLLRLTVGDGALSAYDSVEVTVLDAPPPGTATLERRIAAGSDDAEESATGKVATNSSDLELVYDRSNQRVGLRFTAVTIPTGATVTRAYVQFTADEVQSEATTLLIQGQEADNPATFTAATGNVSTRPRTATSASWSLVAWSLVGEAGVNQRTPDLTGILQEIVSRPGWASGNAIVLIVTGAGHRTARAYEGKAGTGPLLHIEYTSGTAVSAQAAAPEAEEAAHPAVEAIASSGLEAARYELTLHCVNPNPTRGPLRVELSLGSGERASLELVDVTGRRMAVRDVGALGSGRHHVDLRENLPAGIYLVRLTQGSRTRVMKAVVLK